MAEQARSDYLILKGNRNLWFLFDIATGDQICKKEPSLDTILGAIYEVAPERPIMVSTTNSLTGEEKDDISLAVTAYNAQYEARE